MVWRGSSTGQDKVFACLVYSIPILEVLAVRFGNFLFTVVPFLKLLFLPFFYVLPIYTFRYGGLAIVEIGIFIALFGWVVRNHKIVHFLRFHTMQALLMGMFIFLCNAVISLLGVTRLVVGIGPSAVESLFWTPLLTIVFLAIVVGVVYAVIQAVQGLYAELPVFSDAVYRFIR